MDTCKELEHLMEKIWWQTDSIHKTGVSWMSWDRLSRHKHAGGLGFRCLCDFNMALLGKQCWCFLVNDCSLVSRVLKAKYYAHGSLLSDELGDNPSFIWRSISKLRSYYKQVLLEPLVRVNESLS
ncbi:uncharacterized mitochondrial protein AtMg00310-like [Cannabis sativa]|uniref:uncharacterized mitochondrial protein AtMg00310-like n=1 Tax=Cannabis sativa TaxID=3483 RepID=UPI0029CA40BB|nr:uncharacterized mitochondrial protein AtMg00310-like [Cannabis sativa]